MRPITPHLWFDTQALEAAEFYASLLPGSRVTSRSRLRGTPSGDCDLVSFEIGGQPFMAISAGPAFRFNPSISFFLNFDPSRDPQARRNLDAAWEGLIRGGEALMPLDKYPFSERFGWARDRFGLTWQLILSRPEGDPRPFVVPSLMFTGDLAGRAEEALDFYASAFRDSRPGALRRRGQDMGPDKAGSLMFGDAFFGGAWIAAMDSAAPHGFGFNEAVSLLVPCDTQDEIDAMWQRLSADPEGGQCGWTRDRFGVWWQVCPADMGRMLESPDEEARDRVTRAFLKMKKFDLAALRRAFEGA